jgi:hypothetical protein
MGNALIETVSEPIAHWHGPSAETTSYTDIASSNPVQSICVWAFLLQACV